MYYPLRLTPHAGSGTDQKEAERREIRSFVRESDKDAHIRGTGTMRAPRATGSLDTAKTGRLALKHQHVERIHAQSRRRRNNNRCRSQRLRDHTHMSLSQARTARPSIGKEGGR